MRALVLAVAMTVVVLPALAAQWTAEVVEDEGGPRMMASVAGTSAGEFPPELFLFCGGGEINLRYGFDSDMGEGVVLPMDKPLPFTFEFGNGSVTLDMQYEGMDGAYAAYFPKDDKIIALFRSASTVIVDDPTGLYHPQAFPLTGSSDALDTLLKQCD